MPPPASFDAYHIHSKGFILRDMRQLNNWSFRDATSFLKEHGFHYNKPLKGSHQDWLKPGKDGNPDRHVEVCIPKNSYAQKTLRQMIFDSGIDRAEWMKWGSA